MTKRREFIKKSALGTAGIAIGGAGFSSKTYDSIIGANDRINVAVIGTRSRGGAHIRSFCALKDTKNVWVTTLCDVDEQFFKERAKLVIDTYGITPKNEWDICAGVLLITEAGGRCVDLDDQPFKFNQPFPKVNGIIASNGLIHTQVVDSLAPYRHTARVD